MKGPDLYGFSSYLRRITSPAVAPESSLVTPSSAAPSLAPSSSGAGALADRDGVAARVLGDFGSELAIAAPCGSLRAVLPPDLRGPGRPGVGDWVEIDRDGPIGSGPVRVRARLPRSSALIRRASGELGGQLLAANVELALIVTALTFERSPRRLERTVSLVRAGGAEAVVLLRLTRRCQ